MGVKRKKNDKVTASSANANATEQRNFLLRDPVIIPEQIFRSLLNFFKDVPTKHRHVALSVKEYPVEGINDRIGKSRSGPTHLVVFCIRLLLSNKYNPLAVVHINKRLDYVDQLTLLWVAFIQDLSKLGLNVVASVSPCTKMYRHILAQLTRNPNFENCSLPITYLVFPFYIVHLYDYNSIMEEFQTAFQNRTDLCFVSRPWADSNSTEQVYAASWRDIFGVVTPSPGKASYNFLDRLNGHDNLIFLSTFRRNYRSASRNNPSHRFTKLSTDFFLELLWEFSKISEENIMKLDELEKFCVESQELKYMLASAHFKPYRIFNKVQSDNTWFSTFENNDNLNKGSNRIEFNGSIEVEDRGKKAFQNYVNRLMNNEESFIDEETITLMNKESTITKLATAFAGSHGIDQIETEHQKNKALEDTSNLIDKATNPCEALNSTEAVPIKSKKKCFTAPTKTENPNPNEDLMGTSYETFEVSDTGCDIHYLDHVLSPSEGRIKNYLDTFGYSTENYKKLYGFEQANTQSRKMSQESQIDEGSKETQEDTFDEKSKIYPPYKKPESGKYFKNPTVDKNATEILYKTISNKKVKNPNHQDTLESSRTCSKTSKEEGSSEAASEITVDKNSTKTQFRKSKNGQKTTFKEPAKNNHDHEAPLASARKGSKMSKGNNVDFIDRTGSKVSKEEGSSETASEITVDKNATKMQFRKSKNGQKTAFKEPAKNNHDHEIPLASARNGSKMSKGNNVDFIDVASYPSNAEDCKETVSDAEISMLTLYKNAIVEMMERESKKLNNSPKMVSEELTKNQTMADSARSGFKMSKGNVDSKKTASDCLATSEVIVDKNAIREVTEIKSRVFKNGQKPFKELAKNQNHNAPVESSRNSSKMPKGNNANFKKAVSYKAIISEVAVDENATKDAAEIPMSDQKITSEEPFKNKNHKVPVEVSKIASKVSKDINVDSNETFSDSLAGKKDDAVPKKTRFLNKPILKLKVDKNATKATTEIKSNKSKNDPVFEEEAPGKVTKNQESSKMHKNRNGSSNKAKPKSMSLKNEIMQLDLILQNSGSSTEHQSVGIIEGPPTNELSLDQQFVSAEQAIELIKNKQKALENISLVSSLLNDSLSKPAKKNKNGKNDNLKPLFSDRKRKVCVKEDSCQDEINQVIFKAMETMKREPKPDSTKEQKTGNLDLLPELARDCEIDKNKSTAIKSNQNPKKNMSTEQPSIAESKNDKLNDDFQEFRDLVNNLHAKDVMDNFFQCFEPKRIKQKNKDSLSFLQDIFFSSPSYVIESTRADVLCHNTTSLDNLKVENTNKELMPINIGSEEEDVLEIYLDPEEEENFNREIILENNNKESLQQLAENDEIKVIDVEEYRQQLLSDCDKQQCTCDNINVKDKDVVINFFNIIPEGAEVLQITTDWLCTLKGYSKLGEKLKQFKVPLVHTSAFCLDHIDLFVGLVRQLNTERSLGQSHKFKFEELQYLLIDEQGTFEVIERAGPGSGRFIITQDYSRNI